jgi:hypothetical protein
MRRAASQDVQEHCEGISEPEEVTDEETGEKRTETASDWMEGTYTTYVTSWTGRSVTAAPS